ncbi:hypothetical protein [uncultured Ligilactobacillus sp.]|uniref:hypothetical protein n=1 Tax=uncultured Ligilactobacillus sp. TaxID=2837633 RepID=UPI00272D51E0|nr:hypothetical protein [uncultured Ligilactobacillus sp.]
MTAMTSYRYDKGKVLLFIVAFFVGLFTFFSPNVSANTENRIDAIANKYVQYSETEKKFLISPEISKELNSAEIEAVSEKVSATNIQLSKSLAETNPFDTSILVENQGRKYLLNPTYFRRAGVNKVVVKWNHVRVYLSQRTVQLIGGGLAIGGYWIPEAVVSKVAGTLGVVASLTPHGIWFDYNPFLRSFTNCGFQ